MSEVDFNQLADAVTKEIAVAPVKDSLGGLRASEERSKTADDQRRTRRASPMIRIRRVGEGQKRYR